MASACVKNITMSTENFLNCPPAKYPPYAWLSNNPQKPDPVISGEDFVDFEFRLENPATMLAADELFSAGKFVPTHLRRISAAPPPPENIPVTGAGAGDPYVYSPKAPRCSSRWKELLGLKKFLHRNSKDHSITLPLLRDDSDVSVSVSSRHSLSSSSSTSSSNHDDRPRLSLDSNKPSTRSTSNRNVGKGRVMIKHRATLSSDNVPVTTNTNRVGRTAVRRPTDTNKVKPVARGVSMDSPRMNSYGKIVFERSSSSPSTFNGGPRPRHNRGMERSYSANVRVAPVLNVPVFGIQLFSQQKSKDNGGGVGGGGGNRKNRSDNRTRD